MDEIHRLLDEAGERWRASQPAPATIDPVSVRRGTRSGAGRLLAPFAAGAAGAALVLATVGIAAQFGLWLTVDQPNLGTTPSEAGASVPAATGDSGCAVTRPDPAFAAPSPYPSSPPDDRYAWFGTPELWTMLKRDGEVWDAANAPVAAQVKMFFWSSNWAGMREEQEPGLTVVATRLDGPGTVRTDHATNAAAESLGGEAMLSGIEFPTPGCWQITASYRDAHLSFVAWITDD